MYTFVSKRVRFFPGRYSENRFFGYMLVVQIASFDDYRSNLKSLYENFLRDFAVRIEIGLVYFVAPGVFCFTRRAAGFFVADMSRIEIRRVV